MKNFKRLSSLILIAAIIVSFGFQSIALAEDTAAPVPVVSTVPEPSVSPTPEPGESLSPGPSQSMTPEPSESPTSEPSQSTTPEPSASPSSEPSQEPAPVLITKIDTLSPEETAIKVEFGTELSAIPFPALTFYGTALEGVVWNCGNYDPQKTGDYIFTAALPQTYTLTEGITLPNVTVTVLEAKKVKDAKNLSLLSVGQTFQSGGIYYTVLTEMDSTGTVEVADNSGSINPKFMGTTLTIPAAVTNNGSVYDVVAIGDAAFYQCTGIKSLDLSKAANLKTIEEGAFAKCSGITGNLAIPNSVLTIGDYAFERFGIDNILGTLGTLSIPNSVTSIGEYAFYLCNFTGRLVLPNNLKIISEGVFSGCQEFTGELVIPSGVTSIGYSAFSNCSKFTGNLTIPDSVTFLGEFAFNDCGGFNGNIKISANLQEIQDYTFSGCKKLKGNLTIPNNVKNIGGLAFSGCKGLNGNITLSQNLLTIGPQAFSMCSNLKGNLIIPDSVIDIGQWAFNACGFTGNLTLPKNITTINECTFYDCRNFSGSLKIPEGVTFIEESAFQNFGSNRKAGTLTIPNSVTSIGNNAFAECSFTGRLVLPNKLKAISDSAFGGCSGFTGELVIPSGVTSIGEGAFASCTGFSGNLVIPGSVTKINDNAFMYCSGIKGSLTISDNVTYIGNSAFYMCNFNGNLILPSKLTHIGDFTFFYCKYFTGSFSIPSGVTYIGDYAFQGCNGFGIYYPSEGATYFDLYIPYNVKYIGECAFDSVRIRNLTFTRNPAPTIKEYAFLVACVVYYPVEAKASYESQPGFPKGYLPWLPGRQTYSTVYPTSISINTNSAVVGLGKSYSLKASILPGNANNLNVKWASSNTAVATVSSTGTVTGVSPGKATITVTSEAGGRKAACTITVRKFVQSMTISGMPAFIKKGESITLGTELLPADATYKAVSWSSSNSAVATVDSSGKVTGKAGGNAVITAAAKDGSGKTAQATVYVISSFVTSVTLNKESISLIPGKTYTLTKTTAPTAATNPLCVWTTSDPAVATVSGSGVVMAKGLGTATITCYSKFTDNGAKDTCMVNIVKAVESIKITGMPAYVLKGQSAALGTEVLPADAGNKAISWSSSNTAVAKVDSAGKVTGVAAGTATITAKAKDGSGKYASVAIKVYEPVRSVKLSTSKQYLILGKTAALTATVGPAAASKKNIEWSSSDSSIATVSSSGTVTGVGYGTVTITAQAKYSNGVKAACTVEVSKAAAGVQITNAPSYILRGGSLVFAAQVLPDEPEVNKAVSWSSSNTAVAKVDSAGKVTGVAAGTATITAKAKDGSGKYASVAIKVYEPVTSVKLNTSKISVKIGKSFTLAATVGPVAASKKNIEWSSGDSNIATVSSSGVVTAIGKGTVTITALAKYSNGVQTACKVTILN